MRPRVVVMRAAAGVSPRKVAGKIGREGFRRHGAKGPPADGPPSLFPDRNDPAAHEPCFPSAAGRAENKKPTTENRRGRKGGGKWLPDKDSNLNKQSQNLLCYHYTIGQEEKTKLEDEGMRRRLEPATGFEPATACLQNRCSTVELRRRLEPSKLS